MIVVSSTWHSLISLSICCRLKAAVAPTIIHGEYDLPTAALCIHLPKMAAEGRALATNLRPSADTAVWPALAMLVVEIILGRWRAARAVVMRPLPQEPQAPSVTILNLPVFIGSSQAW